MTSHDNGSKVDQTTAASPITRTAQILSVLQRHPAGLHPQSIAYRCPDVSPSSIYHYLRRLIAEGAVRESGEGRFQLDFDYLSASTVTSIDDGAVNTILRHFSHATKHDAAIAAIRDQQLLVTHYSGGLKSPGFEEMVEGFEESLHASGHGYAHMAMMDPGHREKYLRHGSLRRFTPRTAIDPDVIAARLEASNETGIYTEFLNYRSEIACVAAIVHNGAEKYAIATSMWADDFRNDFPRLQEEIANAVLKLQLHFHEGPPLIDTAD